MNKWLKRTWATDKTTKKIGDKAELLAREFLQQKGLTLVAQNYRCRRGEIDLIMLDGNFLVFVEVRYRKSSNYGSAAESITRQKQHRLLTTAKYYLQNETLLGDNFCRFDVITVSGQYNPQIGWIKNAIQAEPD